jgi:hypothetical protein
VKAVKWSEEMDLSRSVYSRDLKITAMRALDAGGEPCRPGQLAAIKKARRLREADLTLRYLGRDPIQTVGRVTGQTYEFSTQTPESEVDARDAAELMQTSRFAVVAERVSF